MRYQSEMHLSIRTTYGEQNSFVSLNTPNDGHKNESSGKTIFAGDLRKNFGTRSAIEQKRQDAQKQVMKLIGDAWSKDEKAASAIEDMKQEKTEKMLEIQEYGSRIKDIEKNKSDLQEEYGIDSESQEQKDLELLEKYQNYMNGSDFADFSKEEIERLSQLQNMPRTQYQNEVLKLNDLVGEMRKDASRAERKITMLTQSITDATIEQLKSQDMIKANDAADEIMGAVDKEIVAMLVEEGMENIDEKMEEEQKKAEEVAKKEEREKQEELIQGSIEADRLDVDTTMQKHASDNMEKVQKKIQNILKDNNLINEDLKGIEIDFNF